jgi:hypothetical protein
MTNRYQHKRSATSGVAPSAAQIAEGEIAINLADKKLFSKDQTNTVFEFSLGAASGSASWVTVTSTGTVNANTRYVAIITANTDFTIETGAETGDQFIFHNSSASNGNATMLVGSSRRFRPLANDDNIIVAPGETINFVASSNTVFEII